MAISVVQSATGTFAGSLTTTATLNGVVANNTLIAIATVTESAGNAKVITASDAEGYYTADLLKAFGGSQVIYTGHRSKVAGGSYTATFTSTAGLAANTTGVVVLMEVSGLAAAPFDWNSSVNGANGTGPDDSGATGTLLNSNSLCLAVLSSFQNWTNLTTPATGGPGTFTSVIRNTGQHGQVDYQLISGSTSSVTASWGTSSGGNKWVAGCAIYKASGDTNPGVVNSTAPGNFGGTNTCSVTLKNVTAGNTIIALLRHFDSGGSGSDVITVSDGNSYTADVLTAGGNRQIAGIFSLFSAGSGDHTITASSTGTAANSWGTMIALEISNISAFDKGSVQAANDTSPLTGSTGALAQANSIYFAAAEITADLSGFTLPPTGGPGIFWSLLENNKDDGSTHGSAAFSMQTQITGTAAVSAAWGTSTSNFWSGAIGVYKGSSGTVSRALLTQLSNQGGF